MKTNIELSLKTREVYQLFERKISGDRLFIEAILHKFNNVINRCEKHEPQALLTYKQIEKKLHELTKQFMAEISKFELLLARKKNFDSNKISYTVQFKPVVTITNQLTIQLVDFIETYDRLITVLKLLNLAGYFEADGVYFINVRRIQKLANQQLSGFV